MTVSSGPVFHACYLLSWVSIHHWNSLNTSKQKPEPVYEPRQSTCQFNIRTHASQNQPYGEMKEMLVLVYTIYTIEKLQMFCTRAPPLFYWCKPAVIVYISRSAAVAAAVARSPESDQHRLWIRRRSAPSASNAEPWRILGLLEPTYLPVQPLMVTLLWRPLSSHRGRGMHWGEAFLIGVDRCCLIITEQTQERGSLWTNNYGVWLRHSP